MEIMDIVWMVLLVGFLLIEGACPIHLVSIWFAAGSLAALVASLLAGPIWLQVLLFLLVSGILLAAFWPLVRKFINPGLKKTNIDAIIGSLGRVTADIDNISAVGQVKLGAMEWTARSTGGELIPAGTLIRVDRIEGVKVFVSPTEVSVSK